MDTSENRGIFSHQIIHFNEVFHYKSIHFGGTTPNFLDFHPYIPHALSSETAGEEIPRRLTRWWWCWARWSDRWWFRTSKIKIGWKSKNRGVSPKMDGENRNFPYENRWFGGYHYFWKHPGPYLFLETSYMETPDPPFMTPRKGASKKVATWHPMTSLPDS